MYFVKRGFKYLKKKKGKTLLIGIIFFVIFNFVLAGLLVQNASEKTQENTRIKIGADVTYMVNMEMFLEDVRKGMIEKDAYKRIKDQLYTGLTVSGEYTDRGGPTYINFMKVIDSDYVHNYDLSVSVNVNSQDTLKEYTVSGGSSGNTETDRGNFTVDFTLASEPMDFVKELSELISGRYATGEEVLQGANVALIEENIAELNNLSEGDTVTVSPTVADYQDAVLEYEIIGIYKTNQELEQRMLRSEDSSLFPQNRFYVPFNAIYSIGIQENDLDNLVLTSNVIRLKDPLYVEKFTSEAESKINFEYGTLDANDALFESLAGPIETLGNSSRIVVIIILIAGALIMALITALTINDRKEEIGILLAIGEKKYKITAQFVLEVLVIAIISFALSIFTGSYIGQNISDSVLESDMLVQQDETGPPMGRQRMGKNAIYSGSTDSISQYEQETSIDISLEIGVLLQLFGLGLALSVISTMIPSLYVMRFNPKQIITNKIS